LVPEVDFIRGAGELGLVLLLFLLGLVLHPDRLRRIFRQASLVTLYSATAFFLVGFGLTYGIARLAPAWYGLTWVHALFIGFTTAFSSTLLVVKLLPTRRLHESAVGTLAIGILIVQDVLAIVVLVVMAALGPAEGAAAGGIWWRLPLGLAMLAAAFPLERYGLRRLMGQVERFDELLLVLSLAWCFALAEGAELLGFSREIGAFVAGLALARSPVCLYIWQKVAPLRDFFVVLLFFSLGALIDIRQHAVPGLLLAALLALVLVLLKPHLFRRLLRLVKTDAALAEEAGWRLGQCSEFGLVIAFLALDRGFIGQEAFEIILITTLLSFLVSTYVVVLKYPSPLGVSPDMQQV
ncbi:MAG: cation:proton antiporter, partial [Acidobacteria bacterium]|nr:cation:proton antiporter [Acidobacteriota bacterium]